MDMEPLSYQSPTSGPGHRRLSSLDSVELTPGPRRRSLASPNSRPAKARKVSRACDFCKSRKAKCSGNQPCSKCVAKGRPCLYNAKYTRGRPPTPPSSVAFSQPLNSSDSQPLLRPQAVSDAQLHENHRFAENAAPSRASPELDMAEIQGQVFDPTSGLTFLHRAWKRLSARDAHSMPDSVKILAETQSVTMAGDRPLHENSESTPLRLSNPTENRMLLALYFDVCLATYRMLHRPSVEKWLGIVERNIEEHRPVWHDLGHARAAIVLVALAIAQSHHEKSIGFFSADDEDRALRLSDVLFVTASRLIDTETGYPKLESAQARLLQVIYLLTTSRFNKSWYVFGTALQLISSIGLHRRESSKRRRVSRADYIQAQCRLRTFWTAYILDNYLGVVFGRPRHFHDDDIDQVFPDRINDEDMTPSGPAPSRQNPEECHVDALILHAKIAQIIGSITRDVYTIKEISDADRIAAAHRHIQRVHEWRASLPLHLGSIRPSMLIPSYRRQATVLKLANSHAIMHASRLFILGNAASIQEFNAQECISAAKSVLETVEYMIAEGPIFHAFWWTHYVTFCALIVVYVWEIQQRRLGKPIRDEENDDRAELLDLAEKCISYLARATASNSPSRRYAVILEEFRTAARSQPAKTETVQKSDLQAPAPVAGAARSAQQPASSAVDLIDPNMGEVPVQTPLLSPHLLDEWQTTDWLELDSSAFWPNLDIDEALDWSTIT